jgi:hypothetical protein
MERVKRFFEWEQENWRTRASSERWVGKAEIEIESLRAYALCQGALQGALVTHFEELWSPLSDHVKLMRNAISKPELLEKFKEDELDESAQFGKWRKKRKNEQQQMDQEKSTN